MKGNLFSDVLTTTNEFLTKIIPTFFPLFFLLVMIPAFITLKLKVQ